MWDVWCGVCGVMGGFVGVGVMQGGVLWGRLILAVGRWPVCMGVNGRGNGNCGTYLGTYSTRQGTGAPKAASQAASAAEESISSTASSSVCIYSMWWLHWRLESVEHSWSIGIGLPQQPLAIWWMAPGDGLMDSARWWIRQVVATWD